MGEAFERADPVGEIVSKLIGPSSNTMLPIRVDKVSLSAPTNSSGGGVFTWQNPNTVAVLAAVIIDITTAATLTCGTLNAGRASGSGVVSDELIDGAVATKTQRNSFKDAGTNGRTWQRIDANGGNEDWITCTGVVQGLSGLAGSAYIISIPVS